MNSAGRSPGNWGPPSFFSRKGALTHHRVGTNSISFAPPQAAGLIHSVVPPFPTKSTTLWEPFCGGGMPAASCALRGGLRLLRQPPDNATSTCWVLLSSSAQTANSLQRAQRIEGRNSLSLLPPACANLPPAALPQRGLSRCVIALFSFAKEKQKKKE